jgi:cytochrome P450
MASNLPVVPLDEDGYWADPYPILAELRENHRTAVTPEGIKAILRWDDAEEIKKRPEFINEGLEYIEARGFKPGDPLYEWRRYSIGALNGEDHRRLRGLVNRALTPKSADKVRPVVRQHVRDLLERHADTGEFDVRQQIRIVPFLSIASFLEISPAEAAEVGQKMQGGGGDAFGPNVTQEIRDRANATFAAAMEFVGQLVESRREEPRDDLLTRLIEAEENGDRLSNEELIVLFTNIFAGAIETTSSVMTSMSRWISSRGGRRGSALPAWLLRIGKQDDEGDGTSWAAVRRGRSSHYDHWRPKSRSTSLRGSESFRHHS